MLFKYNVAAHEVLAGYFPLTLPIVPSELSVNGRRMLHKCDIDSKHLDVLKHTMLHEDVSCEDTCQESDGRAAGRAKPERTVLRR